MPPPETPKQKEYLHWDEQNKPVYILAPDPKAAKAKAMSLFPQLGPLRMGDPDALAEAEAPDPLSPANAATMMPGEVNRYLRRGMEFGIPAIMGGGKPNALIGGAINAGIGEGMDRLGGSDPSKYRPITGGDFLSELISGIPGAGEAGGLLKRLGPLGEKLAASMAKHPVATNTAIGGTSGATSTLGSDESAALPGMLGAGIGFGAGGLGKMISNKMKAAPIIAEEQAREMVNGLAPSKLLPGSRGTMLDNAPKMQALSDAADYIEQTTGFKAKLGDETNKVAVARIGPRGKAAQQVNAANKTLVTENQLEATRRLMEFRSRNNLQGEISELVKQRAKFQNADTPTAKKLDAELAFARQKLEAHTELVTQRRANKAPGVAKAELDLTKAENYQKSLDRITSRARNAQEKAEIEKYAAQAVFDDIGQNTGFHPDDLTPQKRAAATWLASNHPDVIVKDFFDHPEKSVERVEGMVQLFGPNSKEHTAIKNKVMSHMFDTAVDINDSVSPGKALSGKRFGEQLAKLPKETVDYLFDNPNAHQVLVGVEKLLSSAERSRNNPNALKVILGMGGGAGIAGAGYYAANRQSAEEDVLSRPVLIALGTAGVLKSYQSIPKFVESMLSTNSVFSSALRRYAAKQTPGALANVVAASNAFRGRSAPTQEQTPSAPQ